jgi:2,4-dienoyl-CoA reductase-like NADH-dependent reductase (Old Yellow Enzyme family)
MDTQKNNKAIHLQSSLLSKPLLLPCGVIVNNRILKSAMSEAMASKHHAPTKQMAHLYKVWANGGAGLLVTGNVMVDSRHLGEPGNVVVEDEKYLVELSRWAQAGKVNSNHIWMQINHPGKQSQSLWNKNPVAPSSIPLALKSFKIPRALSIDEILDIIKRFGKTAGVAKKAGFTGIQIHGAHGYLVSQFLSPRHNHRSDEFGGNLENRLRFLTEIYNTIRYEVGPNFPVSVKINSSDFQKGGFTENESLTVIKRLSEMGIDLIEISGGNYEAPAMMSQKKATTSTKRREAYFLRFAEKARNCTNTPLAVTGGFRSPQVMEEAIESGAIDFIGLARPLVLDPEFPSRILAGDNERSIVNPEISTGIKTLDRALMIRLTWYTYQLSVIGSGKTPDPHLHPLLAAIRLFLKTGWQNFIRTRV